MDFAYLRQLVGAGLDGIGSARHEIAGGVLTPPFRAMSFRPTAAAAAIGLLSTSLIGKRRTVSRAAAGGLAGTALGLGASMAWASRRFAGLAARRVVQN